MSDRQPEFVDVPVYLLIEPRWRNSYWRDEHGNPILEGGKVVKATAKRPTVGKAGGLITKVTLRIDASCFLPLQPQAMVVVNAGNSEVVEVAADDPRESEEELMGT